MSTELNTNMQRMHTYMLQHDIATMYEWSKTCDCLILIFSKFNLLHSTHCYGEYYINGSMITIEIWESLTPSSLKFHMHTIVQ